MQAAIGDLGTSSLFYSSALDFLWHLNQVRHASDSRSQTCMLTVWRPVDCRTESGRARVHCSVVDTLTAPTSTPPTHGGSLRLGVQLLPLLLLLPCRHTCVWLLQQVLLLPPSRGLVRRWLLQPSLLLLHDGGPSSLSVRPPVLVLGKRRRADMHLLLTCCGSGAELLLVVARTGSLKAHAVVAVAGGTAAPAVVILERVIQQGAAVCRMRVGSRD